jgi:hypothetical protein
VAIAHNAARRALGKATMKLSPKAFKVTAHRGVEVPGDLRAHELIRVHNEIIRHRQVNPLRHHPLKPMLTRDLQEHECLTRPFEFLAEEDLAARRLVDQH